MGYGNRPKDCVSYFPPSPNPIPKTGLFSGSESLVSVILSLLIPIEPVELESSCEFFLGLNVLDPSDPSSIFTEG